MENYDLEFWEKFVEATKDNYNQYGIRLIIFDNRGIYATFNNETTPTFEFDEIKYFMRQLDLLVELDIKRNAKSDKQYILNKLSNSFFRGNNIQ